LGEGEESGELTPGKSLVFAVLEVCLCLLVRQIPALNPNPGGATAILSQRGYIPSEESGKLIALSLNIMESLPTLCSPQGIHNIHTINMFILLIFFYQTNINLTYLQFLQFIYNSTIFCYLSRRDSNSSNIIISGNWRDTRNCGANGQQ